VDYPTTTGNLNAVAFFNIKENYMKPVGQTDRREKLFSQNTKPFSSATHNDKARKSCIVADVDHLNPSGNSMYQLL
jgi:hypothetical protein